VDDRSPIFLKCSQWKYLKVPPKSHSIPLYPVKIPLKSQNHSSPMRIVDSNPRLAGFHLAPVIASSSRGPAATAPHGHIPRCDAPGRNKIWWAFNMTWDFSCWFTIGIYVRDVWDLCQKMRFIEI
jgi:hypothetical protein